MRFVGLTETSYPGFATRTATYERADGRPWRVNIAYRPQLGLPAAESEDCWLILGVCYAFALQESYTHRGCVDARLVRNLKSLMAQWSQWFSHRRPIPLDVDLAPKAVDATRPPGYVVSYYSGGVDSLHTALTHSPRVDALMTVRSLHPDIAQSGAQFARLEELSAFPKQSQRMHLCVLTNAGALPEIRDQWAYMFHGAILLALAHFFEGITLAVLSSSHGYGHLMPWGSHPLTDVLLSSSRLSTAHYGNVYTRVEKTAEVAKDPLALSLLGVCGYGRREHQFVNCSRCEKCLRTMVTLDLVGVDRAHASTFDWTAYDPTKLSKIFLRTDSEASFFEEIIATARRANRPEIVTACERAIQRSRKYRFLVAGELMVRTRVPAVLRYKDQLLTAKSTVYRMLNLQRTA